MAYTVTLLVVCIRSQTNGKSIWTLTVRDAQPVLSPPGNATHATPAMVGGGLPVMTTPIQPQGVGMIPQSAYSQYSTSYHTTGTQVTTPIQV